jgi:hypothetical protein
VPFHTLIVVHLFARLYRHAYIPYMEYVLYIQMVISYVSEFSVLLSANNLERFRLTCALGAQIRDVHVK